MGELDERLIVAAWEQQSFDPTLLTGLGLRLIFRGVPSGAGGPDYQGALLSFKEEVLSGDVEFHVRSSDWYRHGHHRQSGYNNVILHVVWKLDTPETVRADGMTVPVLELGSGVAAQLSGSDRSNSNRLLAHPCVRFFQQLTDAQLEQRVRDAGRLRFQERADHFATEMTVEEPDQVLYAAILEALGYASNREAFRILADILPFRWLASVPGELRSEVLMDASGLGDRGHIDPPVRMSSSSWRLSRLRPANHPVRRIRGVAHLLERCGHAPSESMAQAVIHATRPASLRKLMMVKDGEQTLIGQGRADELVTSVILPFTAALDPKSSKALSIYANYRSPPANRWTRFMLDLLSQAGHEFRARKAIDHQGLHHLYHGFCRRERRTSCVVCSQAAKA